MRLNYRRPIRTRGPGGIGRFQDMFVGGNQFFIETQRIKRYENDKP